MSDAHSKVNVDDERIRMTTWTFTEKDMAIGHHVHEFDYVVVPVTGGTFRVISDDGSEREMKQVAGEP